MRQTHFAGIVPAYLAMVLVGWLLAPSATASLPVPAQIRTFSYPPVVAPTIDSDPALAKPLALGSAARYGDTVEIRVAVDAEGPVDLYVLIQAPGISADLLILTPAGNLEYLSAVGLVPWKTDVSGFFDQNIFGRIPAAGLPKDTYTLFFATAPAGLQDRYHLWATQINTGAVRVGAAGGVVADPLGAKVRIPANTLTGPTPISVSTFGDPGTIPFPVFGPAAQVFGGARFGPDGLVMSRPVTISLPLSAELPPDTPLPLFTYDEARGGWSRTSFTAYVNADGKSADAEVTHFTDYVLMLKDQETMGMLFGWFENRFFDVCNLTPIQQVFDAYTQRISALFPVGSKNIYDLSFRAPRRRYGCYEVVGYQFLLDAERALPDETDPEDGWVFSEGGTYEREVGQRGSVALLYLAEGDRRIHDLRCGEQQMSYQWAVYIHLRCTQPRLDLGVTKSPLRVGDEARVLGHLSCSGRPMVRQRIAFEAEGDGRINRGEVETDNGGFATAMLKGISDATCSDGDVRVHARYNSCAGQEQASALEKQIDTPVIFFLGGPWTATEVANETACGEGVNTYTEPVTVFHAGNVVSFASPSGTGSATKSGCTLTGWSREVEDDGFSYGAGSGTIAQDASSIRGSAPWTWMSSDHSESCSGTSTVTLRPVR